MNIELDGQGVVNFNDGKDAAWREKERGYSPFSKINGNVKVAKKHLIAGVDAEGKATVTPEVFISSNKVRNMVFSDGANSDSLQTAINYSPKPIRNFLYGTAEALTRGWTATSGGESAGLRKSAVCIPDARQVAGALPSIEVQTTSGFKDSNSLTYVEQVGSIKYQVRKAAIDLSELSFLSGSDVMNRRGFDLDHVEIFRDSLKKTFGSEVASLDYYTRTTSSSIVGEIGIKLNEEQVTRLVRFLFEKIAQARVYNRSAYAEVVKISPTLILEDNSKIVLGDLSPDEVVGKVISALNKNPPLSSYEKASDKQKQNSVDILAAMEHRKATSKEEKKAEKADKAAKTAKTKSATPD